jgi:Zn finger protein HypA/HybF involved in hydrogenase expression
VNKNIIFSICLLSVIFLAGHASAAEVFVTPSTKTVIQGQTFNLNISIEPRGTAIAGAQLNIEYNKSVIKINNIIEGNLFKQNGANTFFNNGTINNSLGMMVSIYDMILGPYSVSTQGTFIIINATAVGASGASGIYLSKMMLSDPNGQAIAFNVINGSVNINGTAAEVFVTPSTKTVIQGQTFNLNISIEPRGTAIAGAQLNIEYNKSVIKINNIIEGNLFKQNGANTFFNNGTINNSLGMMVSIYDMILGPYSVSTQGTFIIINATAVGVSGTSGINLSKVMLSDPNGQAIVINVVNGSVNINGTALDIIPPDSVNNLKTTKSGRNFINWAWRDPITPDFAKVMVYVNGEFKTNVRKGIGYYRATGLIQNTPYTISTHTVDTSGNINQTWVNITARTSRR